MSSLNLMLRYVMLCTLTSLVLSEEYLYEEGKILYKDSTNHTRVTLETRNVKYIDNHLLSNAVAVRIVGKIAYLYEGAIRNMPKLKNFSVPSCTIKEISPGAFQSLPNLKNLHLQDNEIQIIEEGVFNGLTVENIFLNRNRIYLIRSGAFDNMPNLRKIHLNKNMLNRWDSQWFKNTPNLMLLYFRRNQIMELPENAFVNLRKSHRDGLKSVIIYLSSNSISYIHPRAFANVHNLRELWLDRNKIERIDRYVFAHFTEIKRLYLHKNLISEIDRAAFSELRSMAELNLSFNRNLTCLDYEVVSKIRKVFIKRNNIYCSCLNNVIEKLEENGLAEKVKIIYNVCLRDDNTEN